MLSNATLVIRPSKAVKIGMPLFQGAVGLGFLALARCWRIPAITGREWLLVAIGLFLVCAAIEFPQRQVVIRDGVLRERLWFHWRSKRLPSHVAVGRDVGGKVAIFDADSGKIVFRFTRELGRPAELEATLAGFFTR